MTTQMILIALATFGLGLFLGSNLGVLVMCMFRVSGRGAPDELTPILAETEGQRAEKRRYQPAVHRSKQVDIVPQT